jgi:hypothetical protein
MMFWTKKQPVEKQVAARSELPAAPKPMTEAGKLNEAASVLALSLNAYSEAAYRAAKSSPDAELQAAHEKVGAARTLVEKGRIAYALGRCLPEHMKHWPSWIEREDFKKYVGFAASDINANKTKEADSAREIEVSTIEFTFNDVRYRLTIRDKGYSPAPGDPFRLGEVELFVGNERVAKFDIVEDYSKEYSNWQFSEVRALKVGQWMQDVLDMAAQIEASSRQKLDKFHDDRVREAAREIDLG